MRFQPLSALAPRLPGGRLPATRWLSRLSLLGCRVAGCLPPDGSLGSRSCQPVDLCVSEQVSWYRVQQTWTRRGACPAAPRDLPKHAEMRRVPRFAARVHAPSRASISLPSGSHNVHIRACGWSHRGWDGLNGILGQAGSCAETRVASRPEAPATPVAPVHAAGAASPPRTRRWVCTAAPRSTSGCTSICSARYFNRDMITHTMVAL